MFSDLLRKRLTDAMFETLIDSLWRDPESGEAVIEFTANASPSILNYDTKYSKIFGQYPKVMLLIDDGNGNELESQHVPVRNRTDGELTSIVYDLGEEFTGKIILYK